MMQQMITHQPAALIILQFAHTQRFEEEKNRQEEIYFINPTQGG